MSRRRFWPPEKVLVGRSAQSASSSAVMSSAARCCGSRLGHPVEPALDDQLGAAGDLGRAAAFLADVADLVAHLGGVVQEVEARDGRLAAGRWQQRREHAERRRLARAVGPEEAEDLALLDVEVDSGDGFDGALARLEGLSQIVGLDHGVSSLVVLR